MKTAIKFVLEYFEMVGYRNGFAAEISGFVGELSLQPDPVRQEILPEGQSGCILDIYSLTVLLRGTPEQLPEIDIVVPTYYGKCQSCVVIH